MNLIDVHYTVAVSESDARALARALFGPLNPGPKAMLSMLPVALKQWAEAYRLEVTSKGHVGIEADEMIARGHLLIGRGRGEVW